MCAAHGGGGVNEIHRRRTSFARPPHPSQRESRLDCGRVTCRPHLRADLISSPADSGADSGVGWAEPALRLYKCCPGDVFKPHTDGDWPGSGLINGKLHLDAFGDRRSAYTLVLYLKDDFEGGETAFYLPRSSVANPVAFGDFDRISVPAVAGAALVFPHGADPRSPVHEGATVSSGTGPSILSEPTCCTGPDSSSPHELARHCATAKVVRQRYVMHQPSCFALKRQWYAKYGLTIVDQKQHYPSAQNSSAPKSQHVDYVLLLQPLRHTGRWWNWQVRLMTSTVVYNADSFTNRNLVDCERVTVPAERSFVRPLPPCHGSEVITAFGVRPVAPATAVSGQHVSLQRVERQGKKRAYCLGLGKPVKL